MKKSTKLFIAGIILLLLPLGITRILSFVCFIAGVISMSKNEGITNRNNPPYKGKDTTPPWER